MKGTIVGVVATAIACIAGIVYTEWRNTDPNISGAWINVSADTITLCLVMIVVFALSILLMLGGRLLWPMVRQRLISPKQRFAELAPELHALKRTHYPSPEEKMRTIVTLEKLYNLGINLPGPEHIIERHWVERSRAWESLGSCFQELAVLADEGRLDQAREVADQYAKRMAEPIRL